MNALEEAALAPETGLNIHALIPWAILGIAALVGWKIFKNLTGQS